MLQQRTALQAAILPHPDAVCLPLLPRLVLGRKMSHDAAASGVSELGSGAGCAPADLPGPCQARAAASGGPSSGPQDEMAACAYTSSLLDTPLPLGFLPCFCQVGSGLKDFVAGRSVVLRSCTGVTAGDRRSLDTCHRRWVPCHHMCS